MTKGEGQTLRGNLGLYAERQWASLARVDVAIAILIFYCFAHLIIRMLLSPNFSLDEAEQVLFGQSLEWGYRFRHPPLMTWLSYAVFTATHTSAQAYFALKYVLMALGLIAYFAFARAVLDDVRLSFLATLGLLTTFVMGFLPHVDLMHTVLLTSMLAAQLWLTFRTLRTRALADYAALGLCVGLGILSKYIFAVGVAGLLVAVLWDSRARARLRLDGMLLAAAIALAVVAPYVWWVITNEYSFFTLAKGITRGQGPALDPVSWLKGAAALVEALIEFAVPFVLLFAACFPKSFRHLDSNLPSDARMQMRVLEISMIAAALMMLAAVFFVGTESFKPRWMHQVLMQLPVYLFLRAKLTGQSDRAYRWFTGICAAFALAVAASSFVIYDTNIADCRRCREYQPMTRFAAELRHAGFVSGTILAEDYDLGGNIRAQFLDSRVVTPGYPLAVFGPPRQAAGQCLFVWLGDKPRPKPMTEYAVQALSVAAEGAAATGRIAAHYLKSDKRLAILHYELLPPGQGECR